MNKVESKLVNELLIELCSMNLEPNNIKEEVTKVFANTSVSSSLQEDVCFLVNADYDSKNRKNYFAFGWKYKKK